jgi:cell division protein DivIC
MAKNNGKRMPAFRRNTHNRMSMALIAVAVIVMTIIVGYSVYNMKIELNENKEKIESLNKDIAKEEKRKEEIEEYKEYTETDEFVEDTAREKLGLVYEDEVVFIKGED